MAHQDDRAAPAAQREEQGRPNVAAASAKRPAPGVWLRRWAIASALGVAVTGWLVGTLSRVEDAPRAAAPEPPEPPEPVPVCCFPRTWHLHGGCLAGEFGSPLPGLLYRRTGGLAGITVDVFADGRVRFNGDPRTERRVTGAAVLRLAALGRIHRAHLEDDSCANDGETEWFHGRGEATISSLDLEEIRRLVRDILAARLRIPGAGQSEGLP